MARNPYEFGVKVSLAVTHKQGLMVGARSFPGNPYDGHVLSAQLEQTSNLLQDLGRSPKQVIVDLGVSDRSHHLDDGQSLRVSCVAASDEAAALRSGC